MSNRKRSSWTITHGMSKTKEYRVWSAMKSRCKNKSQPYYHIYGGRGIMVCDRWRESFENFYSDMGKCPCGFTIERINNDGNYEPGNCVWADMMTQSNNTRWNHIIEHNGITLTIAQWCRKLSLNKSTFIMRLRRGWPMERAIQQPKWNR